MSSSNKNHSAGLDNFDAFLDSIDPQSNLPLVKKLLVASNRSMIRILFGNSASPIDSEIITIHLLPSLPHRHFWSLLPKNTLTLILNKNKAAFKQDLLKCRLNDQSSVQKTFVNLLLTPMSSNPDLKELPGLLWNILWIH